MKINVKATNFSLTPSLSQYLDYKLGKLKRYIDESAGEVLIDVEIGKTTEHHRNGEVFKAEINLDLLGKGLKRSEVIHEDIYTAIVSARDDILKQIKDTVSKETTLFRKGARRMKEMMRWGKNK